MDCLDAAGLKVIRMELPDKSPPVEEFCAPEMLQVIMAPSGVCMVTVLAVLPKISPDTVKER